MNGSVMKLCWISLSFLLIVGFPCYGTTSDMKCYSVEPSKVELGGVIETRQVYGLVNGEESDKKITIYVLKLFQPINVKGNKTDEINTMDFNGVTEIHLFYSKISLEKFVNRKVAVKGTLHEKSAGNEFTDVLMDVKSVKIKK